MHQVTEYLILTALIISIVGFLFALKERSRLKFSNEYLAFSAAMWVVLYLCATQPFFAASLNLSRFVQIAQIPLSVFLVIGFAGVFSVVKRRSAKVPSQGTSPFKILACFMVVLFLFNAGLVYKVAGELNDSPTLMALDTSVDFAKFNSQEMIAAQWIGANASGGTIAADSFRFYAVYTFAPAQARMLASSGSWINLPPGSVHLSRHPQPANRETRRQLEHPNQSACATGHELLRGRQQQHLF